VASNEKGIDPIGSLVGQKGTRVSTVINELGGEKIDIVEWSEDVAKFISSAMNPAKVVEVDINEKKHEAKVLVPEDQLSLAIGKGGQNVRLAAKLTGWKIDVRSAASPEKAIEGGRSIEAEETLDEEGAPAPEADLEFIEPTEVEEKTKEVEEVEVAPEESEEDKEKDNSEKQNPES
jgi:N utilization substance protein A